MHDFDLVLLPLMATAMGMRTSVQVIEPNYPNYVEEPTPAQAKWDVLQVNQYVRPMYWGGGSIPPNVSGRGVRAEVLRAGSERRFFAGGGFTGQEQKRLLEYRHIVQMMERDLPAPEINDRLDLVYRFYRGDLERGGFLAFSENGPAPLDLWESTVYQMSTTHSDPPDDSE